MTNHAEISAQTVVRDHWGGWTHPDFLQPAKGGDVLDPDEFKTWLYEHNLTSATAWMANDVPEWQMEIFWKSGNWSDWLPSGPTGDGWFIGSIHDTEEGPVCIWLRSLLQEHAE